MPPEAAATPASPATSTPAEAPSAPAPVTTEPSATPSPEPSGGDTTANVFDGFDFSNMDFAEETGDTVKVDNTQPPPTEQGKPEAPVEKKAPEPAPAPQAPVQAPAPEPQTIAPPVPQTPAPATATPPGSAEAGTEDPYLKAWKDNQERLNTELENYYSMDEATAEKFLEAPREVLPKLLAKLHMAVLQNTYKTVIDRLPPLMEATVQSVKSHAEAEDKFYKAWPVFKRDDPAHVNVLMQYGQLYRQQNPGASEADFVKFVGAAAAAHLSLKMPVATKGNGKGKPTPYSPAANSAPASGSGEPAPNQMDDFMTAVQSE